MISQENVFYYTVCIMSLSLQSPLVANHIRMSKFSKTLTFFIFHLCDIVIPVTVIAIFFCIIKGYQNEDCGANSKQEDNIGARMLWFKNWPPLLLLLNFWRSLWFYYQFLIMNTFLCKKYRNENSDWYGMLGILLNLPSTQKS